MINRRWFFAVLIVALAAMMAMSRCRGCHLDVPLTTSSTTSSSTDSEDDDRIFKQLRLDIIKEKMLRRLGLSGPPTIVHSNPYDDQNSLRRALRMLPIGRRFSLGHRRRPRHPHLFSVASNGNNSNNKVTRVIVFAELTTPCVTPVANAKTSDNLSELTMLTFKLPRVPSVIRNAVLWYKTSAESSTNIDSNSTKQDTTTNLDSDAWLCPCGGGGSINVTHQDSSGSGRCTPHASISSESKVSADGQKSRRGWNYVRFPGFGGLASVQASQYGNGERRYVTFFVGSASVMSEQKRPFLVLEVVNRMSRSRRNRRSDDDRPTDCAAFPGVNRGLQQQQPRCCRTSFWVDIRQLGWSNWIISPPGFYYHYCSGRCDSTFDSISSSSSNGSNGDDGNNGAGGQALLDYSQVMNAYVKRFQLNLKPCCVPRTMSHLPVVITTDGLTLNRTYIPNFIMNECACLGVA